MAGIPASFPLSSERLVLRNLTMKEFVAQEELAANDPNFSHALLVQTQFTDDPSGLGDLDCIGEWAGHRFDVATIEDVDEDEGWEDVIERVIDLASAVEW
ncbi:hypothetical protein PG985_005854 [Apiospora marii]|uniref:uncharacterized protein n=1 Tax=Apiospora marii TaxID=335849 RepID=UPI0031301A89